MLQNKNRQTFNDGVLFVHSITNEAAAGETPKDKLTLKVKLPFEERTVGMNRFFTAKQHEVEIERLLRCPYISTVNLYDVVVLTDEQYVIEQLQHINDVTPRSMDLSLSRIKRKDEYQTEEV